MPDWTPEEVTRIAAIQESDGVSRSVAIRRMRAQDKAAAEAKGNSDILSESQEVKKHGIKQKGDGKKERWMVTYTNGGVTSPFTSNQYKTEAEAQAVADEYNSGTTVKSVAKSNDADVKKRAEAELAKQRKQHLKEVESVAARLVKTWNTMTDLDRQSEVIYRKYAEAVEEFKPQLENLRYEFRHLKEGETINGHTSLETWCPEFLGVTARTFRRGLQVPKQVPLLPAPVDGNPQQKPLPEVPEKQENGIEDADYTDMPSTPEAEGEQQLTVPQLLADTKPSLAIGVSPADVVSNSVKDNSRLILQYARSFAKLMNEREWQDCLREVIKGLQYELPDDEPEVQMMLNVVPTPATEGEQVVA